MSEARSVTAGAQHPKRGRRAPTFAEWYAEQKRRERDFKSWILAEPADWEDSPKFLFIAFIQRNPDGFPSGDNLGPFRLKSAPRGGYATTPAEKLDAYMDMAGGTARHWELIWELWDDYLDFREMESEPSEGETDDDAETALSERAVLALRLLRELPANGEGVAVSDWRARFYSVPTIAKLNPAAAKKSFRRAREELAQAGWVTVLTQDRVELAND